MKDLKAQAAEVLDPLSDYARQCHAASIKLVRAGLAVRVARGFCEGVGSQHSWAVLGDDCYSPDVRIVDPTLWSYTGSDPEVWVGSAKDGLHRPHGSGIIWQWGRPSQCDRPDRVIKLTPRRPFSDWAETFLGTLGPLDYEGWSMLAHAPVGGWPSGEVFEAMHHTEGLGNLVPIDVLGMTTNINPGGLYLPGPGEGVGV